MVLDKFSESLCSQPSESCQQWAVTRDLEQALAGSARWITDRKCASKQANPLSSPSFVSSEILLGIFGSACSLLRRPLIINCSSEWHFSFVRKGSRGPHWMVCPFNSLLKNYVLAPSLSPLLLPHILCCSSHKVTLPC